MIKMKKLGQIFLIDETVAEREIKYANVNNNDIVLEIGTGQGIITKNLAKKAKRVIAIEIDKKLCEYLKKILPENVEIINEDATKIDFATLPRFNKIVANIPFQISSEITFKILNYDFDIAVLIYQKEFAQRLVAKPGTKHYSRLTVNVYYRSHCNILELVPRSCFKPQPKVDSCIVSFIRRKEPAFYLANEYFFFDLTRKLFNNRRKKIKNVIKEYIRYAKDIPYLENRVEELAPEQIGELSNMIYKVKKHFQI